MKHRFVIVSTLSALAALTGCATTKTSNTARSAMEQLLIANAVDQALDKVDFTPFAGRKVYLDDKYVDCTDKNYVISSVRHRLLRAGANIQEKADTAEIGIEIRTGTVGTDQADQFIGIPEIGVPGMVTIPELRLVNRKNQTATAKIGLVAYDYATKTALGDGGMTLARSDENQWFVFGVGPYRGGTVYKEVAKGLKQPQGARPKPLPTTVAFQAPPPTVPAAGELKFASGETAPEKPQEPAKLPGTPAAPATPAAQSQNPAEPNPFEKYKFQ